MFDFVRRPHERFWTGRFGDEYTDRNQVDPSSRVAFFQDILRRAPDVRSACELGANKGHNLEAFRMIEPAIELTGVELNSSAWGALTARLHIRAVCSSILEFHAPPGSYDLVFTCGVLIHMNPGDLPEVY